MSNNKIICMIMYGMATGGAELQFLELAQYLRRKIRVVVFGIGGKGDLAKEFQKIGIECHVCQYDGKVGAILCMMKVWLRVLMLRPFAVVSTSHIANVVNSLCSLYIRNTITMQTVSICMAKRKWLDRIAINRLRLVLAGAEDIKNYLILHGIDEKKIRVVHNWTDLSKRNIDVPKTSIEAYRSQLIGNKTVLAVSIGRLHQQKGHRYLIKAAEKFPENVMTVIAGDGPERNVLEKIIIESSLEDQVKLIGEIRGKDYDKLIASADVIIQPSLFEGLPRTLLDAMYHGKVVIATRVNGNVEAINDSRYGILVKSHDENKIAEAVENFIFEMPDRLKVYISTNARARIIENFEMNTQLAKIENLILCEY